MESVEKQTAVFPPFPQPQTAAEKSRLAAGHRSNYQMESLRGQLSFAGVFYDASVTFDHLEAVTVSFSTVAVPEAIDGYRRQTNMRGHFEPKRPLREI